MAELPERWRVYRNRGPEVRAQRLKRRFQKVSRRLDQRVGRRQLLRSARMPVMVALGAGAITWGLMTAPWSATESSWSAMTSAKHLPAAPNCDAARAVGLAPAYRGQPGYWPRHDRDDDGIACEPWRGR